MLDYPKKNLQKKIGISRSCLANYETGKRQPDIDIIQIIANTCNVPPEVLSNKARHNKAVLSESNPAANNHMKILVQSRGNYIDISHLPLERRISVFDYYDYIVSMHHKKKEITLG